ncbi:MAG: hypothetical protein JNM69_06375, partial [Archangium sp.]|nr:hypothetical protein [Archangium sp.]
MRNLLCLLVLLPGLAAAQRRLPFEFDAGLPQNPTLTAQKVTALNGAMPSWVQLPSTFESLQAGPQGVTTPTVTVWFAPEMKAQFLRTLDAGTAPMTWPAPVFCSTSATFVLPATSLLAAGASTTCQQHEATIRQSLTATNLATCLELEEPERFVSASTIPSGLSQSQLNSYVDARTNTLEQQLGLAGAGLARVPAPEGMLPADWVPTMRRVLWKVRPSQNARVTAARAAFQTVISRLTSDASCFDATRGPALRLEVTQLSNELDAIDAHISQTIAAGTARALVQQQCLGARSRTRPVLPYPSLTDEEREFVAFWLGGVFWRMRGGGLIVLGSTQNARTFFARRPFREIARIANGTTVAERAADSIYCNLFDGWGSWMDMGTSMNASAPAEDNQDAYYDLVQMTDRGRQQAA